MINTVISILGLIAILGVVGIWVAWTNEIFFGVLGTIVVVLGALIAILLLMRHKASQG